MGFSLIRFSWGQKFKVPIWSPRRKRESSVLTGKLMVVPILQRVSTGIPLLQGRGQDKSEAWHTPQLLMRPPLSPQMGADKRERMPTPVDGVRVIATILRGRKEHLSYCCWGSKGEGLSQLTNAPYK